MAGYFFNLLSHLLQGYVASYELYLFLLISKYYICTVSCTPEMSSSSGAAVVLWGPTSTLPEQFQLPDVVYPNWHDFHPHLVHYLLVHRIL